MYWLLLCLTGSQETPRQTHAHVHAHTHTPQHNVCVCVCLCGCVLDGEESCVFAGRALVVSSMDSHVYDDTVIIWPVSVNHFNHLTDVTGLKKV